MIINSLEISGKDLSKSKIQEMVEKMMIKFIGKETKKSSREYIKRNYKNWIESAVKAKFEFKEDKDYVITEDPETKKEAVKIINLDTGETEENSRWKHGLHFFVEQKNYITSDGFSASSFFEHHVNFFKKYGSNLVGLTGTLGSGVCQEFLKNIYKVDCLQVPTFKQKKFLKLDPCICINSSSWHRRLIQEIYTIQRKKRPCLILFETILEAKEFMREMNKNGLNHISYLRSDVENSFDSDWELKQKSIVVATNLGGRGTDFKISSSQSKRGGLHVILTFLSSNLRIEKQAFGRAARKGEFGTGRLILNNQKDPFLNNFIKFKIIENVILI
jgi:preprotein translocase subunit SecA